MLPRSVLILAGVAMVLAAAQSSPKIGEVQEITGHWCRQGVDLRKGAPVFLSDQILYCGKPMRPADQIVIRFDRPSPQPPRDRPYKCSTPGLCDRPAALWLEGGASLSEPVPPPGGITVSSPPTTSLVVPPAGNGYIFPDSVIEQGSSGGWNPAGLRALDTPPEICSVQGTRIGPCEGYTKNPSALSPGLYGIYRQKDHTAALGVIGVVPRHSPAIASWERVPDTVKRDTSPQNVEERRAYIMKLVNGRRLKDTVADRAVDGAR